MSDAEILPAALGHHVGFDLMAWSAGVASGVAVYRWRLVERHQPIMRRVGGGYFVALFVGCVAGGLGFGTANLWLSGVHEVGRSILGALAGGVAAVEVYKRNKGISGSTGAVFAVPLLIGIAVGRIGCFVTGLPDHTFGLPAELPWAVDHGDGVQRHPVQLYESAVCAALAVALLLAMKARRPWALRNGFYFVVIGYCVQRFALEFLKPYAALVATMNLFHFLCIVLIGYGLIMWRTLDD